MTKFDDIPFRLHQIYQEIKSGEKQVPADICDHLDNLDSKLDAEAALLDQLQHWLDNWRQTIGYAKKEIFALRQHLDHSCHGCGSTDLEPHGTDLVCQNCGLTWCNWDTIDEEKK